jgi:hypothetical protein
MSFAHFHVGSFTKLAQPFQTAIILSWRAEYTTYAVSFWNYDLQTLAKLLEPFLRKLSLCGVWKATIRAGMFILTSTDLHVWWINSQRPNMNKIHPTVHALTRRTCIQTALQKPPIFVIMWWTAGVRFSAVARDFPLLHSFRTGPGPTRPPVQWGPRAVSPGVTRPGREAMNWAFKCANLSARTRASILFFQCTVSIPSTLTTFWCGYMKRSGHAVTWLRHYTISREVADSIPYEVIGFINWLNPSSRTMALGSTQPLTEMRTTYLSGGKGRAACKADFTAICEPTV